MDDLHKIWPHRWVNPKTKQGQSTISGNGLMATDNIAKGEPIIVYGGVIVPNVDLSKYRSIFGDYDYPIDDDFSIAPTTKDELMTSGAVNHSCQPNIGWKNTLVVVTIRDVEKCEELSPDYSMMGGYPEPFTCNCGKLSCRKIITADDWKNEEIRKKYGEYFIPILKKSFR